MRKQWTITAMAALALTALAVVLAVSGVIGTPVAAQSPAPGTITVRGFGEASGAPDLAYVSLGADTRNANLSEAMSEAATIMDAVIEAVRGLDIAAEDIQTVEFSVWSDEPAPLEEAPTAEGTRIYRVTNVVRITVRDTSLMQGVIDAAVAAGANRIYGVTFGLEDPAALEAEARVAALENARERAGQIAQAIGVTLGEPSIVVEGDSFGGGVVMETAARSLGGGGIQQGQLTVQVQVQVTFETVR